MKKVISLTVVLASHAGARRLLYARRIAPSAAPRSAARPARPDRRRGLRHRRRRRRRRPDRRRGGRHHRRQYRAAAVRRAAAPNSTSIITAVAIASPGIIDRATDLPLARRPRHGPSFSIPRAQLMTPDSPLVDALPPSPNHGERLSGPADTLILHYTGMPTGEAALGLLLCARLRRSPAIIWSGRMAASGNSRPNRAAPGMRAQASGPARPT